MTRLTDRELLEWAAKAAGWVYWDWLAEDGVLNVYDENGRHDRFNPLTDDGDALRLAVKLKLLCGYGGALTWIAQTSDGSVFRIDQCDDPCAATRRAIVRAAAAIGKEMK